jgi:cytochrome c oxidase assembly protein subunit 15
LAGHFITALALFVYILWTALGVLYPPRGVNTGNKTIKKLLNYLLGALVVQLVYGALVAGLKAGLIFPTFPKMNSEWMPSSIGMALELYGLKSFTEFPALVQFIHRWLAAIIVVLVIWAYVKGRNSTLSLSQNRSLLALLIMVCVQFLLGVCTLLYLVPLSLGVLHQLGAVILLTNVIIAIFCFKNTTET